MAEEAQQRFLYLVAGMTGIDDSIDSERLRHIIDFLAEFDITSVKQLDSLASTALWRDGFRHSFKTLVDYIPFLVNDVAQVRISKFVTAFGKAHGARSSGAILLAIISNVVIPSLGSTTIAKGTKNLRPTYSLPDVPKYWHPGIHNNPEFDPIVIMPLSTFVVANALFAAISSLTKPSAWAKPAVGMAAAAKQTFEAWQLLQGKREKITEQHVVDMNDGKKRFCQRWLQKEPEDIREDLQNLLNPRMALKSYLLEFAYESLAKAPRNAAAAMVDPATVATGISLAPSAACGYLGAISTDPTEALAWNIIAGVTAIGIGLTGIGLTNQASWQWVLQRATFNRWSPENADKFGEHVQKYTENLVGHVITSVVSAPGIVLGALVSIWEGGFGPV